MDIPTLKALLIQAAYQGAIAVCEPLTDADGSKIQIDPLIGDTGLRKKGLCVYEEAKVQYAAIVRAFEDQTGIWPDPKVAPGPTVAGSGPASAPGPTSVPDVASIAKDVRDVISAVVPLPGKELTK